MEKILFSSPASRQSVYDSENKIWSGQKAKDYFNPKLTIGEAIRLCLMRNINHIAQISDNSGVSLTNFDILVRSLKIGHFVQKLNLQPGDVAGVIARNTENLTSLLFGLLYCGITINTLDTSFAQDEILNLFEYTKPKIIFCDSDVYTTVKKSLNILKNDADIFTVRGRVYGGSVKNVEDVLESTSLEDAASFQPNEPEDGRTHTAFIMCSSGTTGLPKGVCLPHSAFLSGIMHEAQPGIYLSFSSIYWMSGVATILQTHMSGSTRIITDQPFSPELLLRIVEQYKVTTILLPPAHMAVALKCPDIKTQDLSTVRLCVCGGGPLPHSLVQEFKSYLPNGCVYNGYALTEGGMNGIFNLNAERDSVGLVGKNMKLKIIDDDGFPLGPNENGEICLKPKYGFSSYCGKPDETRNTLDEDGWIHTGDVGHVDDEGYVYIVERKKEIMKYFSFQVSPSEIEKKILELSDVVQVCVCGIPDMVAGDLPAAVCVRRANSKLVGQDVQEFIKKNMSDAKQLRGGVYFVDRLPWTASGKVQRKKVREIALRFYEDFRSESNRSYATY